ncbi:MAG: drug/metabolite exporter YedA [Burkholderiaceae bacterium]
MQPTTKSTIAMPITVDAAPSDQPVFLGLSTAVLVALLTVYVVWGSTYFAIRLTLESLPPFLQGGARFLVAGTLLFVFLAVRGRPMPTLRQWRDGAIVGVLLLTCGNGGVVFAEQYVSSSVAAIFIGAGPLAAALWSGLFGFWPQRAQWVGIVIGFVGVLMLAGGAQLSAHPIGLIGLVTSVVCWTLGSVLAQRKLSLAPGAMGFATEMLAGGAVMLIVGLLHGEAPRLGAAWPPTPVAIGAFVYLVFAGSLAAFSAYMYLLSKVSSTIAISYAYVNPMIAVLLGVVFGGEVLTTKEGIATAVIVGSVILLTLERRTT